MTRQRLVAANWKMNGSREANAAWTDSFLPRAGELACDVLVCAPFVYLDGLSKTFAGTKVMLGAENVNEFAKGAYTGEISAPMLRDVGCSWTLVGHSERRTYYGDDDQRVAAKCKAAVDAGLKIMLCVGETLEERENGETIAVVSRQLMAVIAAVGVEALVDGAVAYEPVWAIGTGKTATPEMAQDVHQSLRAAIAKIDPEAAQKVRILYGGSVKPSNAKELFGMPDIDGGLIGGAALKADDFYGICAA